MLIRQSASAVFLWAGFVPLLELWKLSKKLASSRRSFSTAIRIAIGANWILMTLGKTKSAFGLAFASCQRNSPAESRASTAIWLLLFRQSMTKADGKVAARPPGIRHLLAGPTRAPDTCFLLQWGQMQVSTRQEL
jgi:hypothetical protein